MAIVERIEYYSNCPSCGAAGEGREVCEYCGTSLVRQRHVMESATTAENLILEQDAGLPVERGKLCEVSSFLKIFCPLFGGIFLAVPLIILIAFIAAGIAEGFVIMMLIPFFLIGVGGLAPLIVAASNKGKCERGCIVQGLVRGYEDGNYLINNRPVQVMRIRIDETDRSKIVLLSTGESSRSYAIGSLLTLRNNGRYYRVEG